MLAGYAYTETSLKNLETIPGKFRGQIKKRVEALVSDPYPQGCKRLKDAFHGEDPVHRIRSGDYRILYVVKGNPHQIFVLDIDNRKDVYR